MEASLLGMGYTAGRLIELLEIAGADALDNDLCAVFFASDGAELMMGLITCTTDGDVTFDTTAMDEIQLWTAEGTPQ